jgi:hypothetical protein
MSLDAILEVAIGLVFSWLVLSAAASQVEEFVNNLLQLRSVYLEQGILNILGDQTLVDKFFQHPVIQALCEQDKKTGKFKKPSYIPAINFSQAAFDVLVSPDELVVGSRLSPEQIRSGLKANDKAPDLTEHLFPDLDKKLMTTEATIAYARANLEQQFDASMDRVTGWFKRNAQKWAFGIGIALALVLNVDTVQIATQLWTQPTQRAMLVAQVGNTSANNQLTAPTGSGQDFAQLYQQAQNFSLPIGWATQSADCRQIGFLPGQATHPGFGGPNGNCQQIVNLPGMNDLWGWLGKIFGILISGIAAAQGAPFWFNALSKLIGLRGSGPTPPPSGSQAQATVPVVVAPVTVPGTQVPPEPQPGQPAG